MAIGVCSTISALCCICLCWMKRRKSRCTSVQQFIWNCWSCCTVATSFSSVFLLFLLNSHRKETCSSEVSVAMCSFQSAPPMKIRYPPFIYRTRHTVVPFFGQYSISLLHRSSCPGILMTAHLAKHRDDQMTRTENRFIQNQVLFSILVLRKFTICIIIRINGKAKEQVLANIFSFFAY